MGEGREEENPKSKYLDNREGVRQRHNERDGLAVKIPFWFRRVLRHGDFDGDRTRIVLRQPETLGHKIILGLDPLVGRFVRGAHSRRHGGWRHHGRSRRHTHRRSRRHAHGRPRRHSHHRRTRRWHRNDRRSRHIKRRRWWLRGRRTLKSGRRNGGDRRRYVGHPGRRGGARNRRRSGARNRRWWNGRG